MCIIRRGATVIDLLLRLLLAISTHTECQIGDAVDYYAWVDAHPDYHVPVQIDTPTEGDYWLMEADGEYYLFAFADTDALDGSANQHGRCFRKVG